MILVGLYIWYIMIWFNYLCITSFNLQFQSLFVLKQILSIWFCIFWLVSEYTSFGCKISEQNTIFLLSLTLLISSDLSPPICHWLWRPKNEFDMIVTRLIWSLTPFHLPYAIGPLDLTMSLTWSVIFIVVLFWPLLSRCSAYNSPVAPETFWR